MARALFYDFLVLEIILPLLNSGGIILSLLFGSFILNSFGFFQYAY
jgi:hypothetical protein